MFSLYPNHRNADKQTRCEQRLTNPTGFKHCLSNPWWPMICVDRRFVPQHTSKQLSARPLRYRGCLSRSPKCAISSLLWAGCGINAKGRVRTSRELWPCKIKGQIPRGEPHQGARSQGPLPAPAASSGACESHRSPLPWIMTGDPRWPLRVAGGSRQRRLDKGRAQSTCP